MSESIGLIGLGLLGSALAERLMRSGFSVLGYDVDSDRRHCLVDAGGRVAADAVGVTQDCRRILLSLPDATVSRSVIQELRPHLSNTHSIIDTTTGSPRAAEQLGDELSAAGIGYVDATVAGSSTQAREGQVLLLVGGDPHDVDRSRDVLEAVSSNVYHLGPCGSGARMKLVVNLVLGLNRAVLAEGLAFAQSQGVDPRTALEVLRASPAASTVMDTKGEKMVTGDFAPQARLRQHLKDVRLILDAAGEGKTPLSELHAELLQSLVDRGFGDEDNSAIVRAFETRDPPTSVRR